MDTRIDIHTRDVQKVLGPTMKETKFNLEYDNIIASFFNETTIDIINASGEQQ
jgi:hypothetical protein